MQELVFSVIFTSHMPILSVVFRPAKDVVFQHEKGITLLVYYFFKRVLVKPCSGSWWL